MSPTERAYWLKVQRRAHGLSPELSAKLLRAFRVLREGLSDAELTRLMASHNVELLFSGKGPLDAATIRTAFLPVRERFRSGVVEASKAFARDLPGKVTVGFDILHPNVIEGIRQLETKVMTTLEDGVRETVRAYVEQGIREGMGPRAIGRDLRAILGLAPNQLEAVANFERMLEAGDREALTRALRDKRFDGTLRKAFAGDGLSPAQIDTMTDAYRRRMIAFNAETNARTAALDAQKLGQKLTIDQAVQRGDIDGDRLHKRWRGVRDDREREDHWEMDRRADDGEAPRWDEPFSNGQMIPGETDFNCRCLAMYFVQRAA